MVPEIRRLFDADSLLTRQQQSAVQFGNIVPGVFAPVLAKHSKSLSLIDGISVGVDRMQRNFEPMRKQREIWPRSELIDVTANVVIYEAFVEGSKHLARTGHDLYFEPKYGEFQPGDDLESLERVHLGEPSRFPGARSWITSGWSTMRQQQTREQITAPNG